MMGVGFAIEAVCIAAFGFFGTTATSFVITDALVFLRLANLWPLHVMSGGQLVLAIVPTVIPRRTTLGRF
jgi:MFS transporter, OFA family, oxalate/formate antiporter